MARTRYEDLENFRKWNESPEKKREMELAQERVAICNGREGNCWSCPKKEECPHRKRLGKQ